MKSVNNANYWIYIDAATIRPLAPDEFVPEDMRLHRYGRGAGQVALLVPTTVAFNVGQALVERIANRERSWR